MSKLSVSVSCLSSFILASVVTLIQGQALAQALAQVQGQNQNQTQATGLVPATAAASANVRSVSFSAGAKLEIRAWAANINFVANPTLKSLKITGLLDEKTESAWNLTTANGIIKLMGPDAATAKKSSLRTIQIEGPSMPVHLALREGQVSFNSWSSMLSVVLTQGKLSIQQQSGPISVSMQKGDLNIAGLSGSAKLDLYEVSSNLKDINSDIDWSQHAGNASIEKHQGNLSFNSYAGNFKSVAGQGSINFESVKGPVAIYQFAGRVDGNTQESVSNLQLLADSEINVKSNSGKISIQTPTASGALLNLAAEDGEILTPPEISIRKNGAEKSVKARMKGSGQKLSIFARTTTGTIQVR